MNRSPSSPGSNNPPDRQKFLEVVLYPPVLIVRSQKGHCQVDEELVDQPPRYWAPARRDPAMLGIKNGRQPQLDNTGEGLHLVLDSTGLSRESCHQQGVAPIRVCNLLKSCASAVHNLWRTCQFQKTRSGPHGLAPDSGSVDGVFAGRFA